MHQIRNNCFHPISKNLFKKLFSLISHYSSNIGEPFQPVTGSHGFFLCGFFSVAFNLFFIDCEQSLQAVSLSLSVSCACASGLAATPVDQGCELEASARTRSLACSIN